MRWEDSEKVLGYYTAVITSNCMGATGALTRKGNGYVRRSRLPFHASLAVLQTKENCPYLQVLARLIFKSVMSYTTFKRYLQIVRETKRVTALVLGYKIDKDVLFQDVTDATLASLSNLKYSSPKMTI